MRYYGAISQFSEVAISTLLDKSCYITHKAWHMEFDLAGGKVLIPYNITDQVTVKSKLHHSHIQLYVLLNNQFVKRICLILQDLTKVCLKLHSLTWTRLLPQRTKQLYLASGTAWRRQEWSEFTEGTQQRGIQTALTTRTCIRTTNTGSGTHHRVPQHWEHKTDSPSDR